MLIFVKNRNLLFNKVFFFGFKTRNKPYFKYSKTLELFTCPMLSKEWQSAFD